MLTESRWVSTLFFPFRGLDNGVNLTPFSAILGCIIFIRFLHKLSLSVSSNQLRTG
jgi:hypothetical protein